MSPASVSITFHLEIFGRHVTLSREASAGETLESVSLKLLRSTGIGDSLEGWEIFREEGEPLKFSQKVSELVRDRWSGNISVTMRLSVQLPPKAEDATSADEGPRLPPPRPVAPKTRHDMHLPNANDLASANDKEVDEEKAFEPTNGKSPKGGAPPAPKAPPAAKKSSKPTMLVPKPGAAPSKPVVSAPKPPSKPMMAPPKPAAKPPSKPMMAPPKPAAPAAAQAPAPPARNPVAPAGKKEPEGLVDTDFDIPPIANANQVVAVDEVAAAPVRSKQRRKAEEVDLAEESVFGEAEEAPRRQARAAAPRTAERRATVRYYNRMNPQRVFPLLVVISKEMIERAAKSQSDQKTTAPFTVALDSAIEVEPVLPGCYCYPPKATARLSDKDLTLTFHVVPHVLGEVTGACIRVRQDHFDLATIDLDIRVTQRTWVLVTGALTIALPFVSALARHLRLDLASQDVYVMAMNAVVNHVPPYALMGGLALTTLLAYWLTRSCSKDTFFDVSPITPEEKLRQIHELLETDPSRAADELVYLLKAQPDHHAARLLLADSHFRLGNHADALAAYQEAFAKGKTEERHYLQAGHAAAKLGDWINGSKILDAAEQALTRERMNDRAFEDLRLALRGAARQTV